jgi:hypothetical protein
VPHPAFGGIGGGGELHFSLRQSFEIPGGLKFTEESKKSGLGLTDEVREKVRKVNFIFYAKL